MVPDHGLNLSGTFQINLTMGLYIYIYIYINLSNNNAPSFGCIYCGNFFFRSGFLPCLLQRWKMIFRFF